VKQIVVISGKGGTGKTIVTAAFASLAEKKVLADCDVDAANLHLMIHPEIKETHTFTSGEKAVYNEEKCTYCGACVSLCRFDAIHSSDEGKISIDPFSCEGCRVCALSCPVQAIEMKPAVCGEWYISQTKYGPFVHARLYPGEENSGKLVSLVREKAREIAESGNLDWVLIDGPPGIGCPVIASLSGVDLAVVVTEPTLSAVHDMERVIETSKYFKIKTACIINKYDINKQNTHGIITWCQKNNIKILGKISYSEDAIKAVTQGIPIPELPNSDLANEIKEIWLNLKNVDN
jgi:MinD superfamily P-loop ATPase